MPCSMSLCHGEKGPEIEYDGFNRKCISKVHVFKHLGEVTECYGLEVLLTKVHHITVNMY